MRTVSVLIIVDVEGALASGNLQDNVYMVDNNKHFGSGNEGSSELYTAVSNYQQITWMVTPIVPQNDVQISGFTGQAIKDKVIAPQKMPAFGNNPVYWEAQVNGSNGTYQYSVSLTLDGKEMTFDPYLKIS